MGGVSYGENKEWLGWLCPMPPYSRQGMCPRASCDPWKWQEEEGHLCLVATVAVVVLVWRCQPLWHMALASHGSARPTLPAAKEKHMARATLPAQQCQEQKPGCYKPCPEKRLFYTSINFKEREERRRRGAFALLSLMKYNQSRECILCFQPDIPSMCLAR